MDTINAGIYGGGPLYSGGPKVIEALRASGMTTIVAWSVHVEPNGDLVFNDKRIVSDGKYVGEEGWPKLMASLKQTPTSVTRLLFSVGAGGVEDFHHVQKLIAEQGTGPESILYRNFEALKATIPAIDGIDFDDEDLMDAETTVTFARMLHQLGLTVTFCPYYNAEYWVECLKELNGTTPGLVTGFNLQCYSGGGGNEPGSWIDEIAKVMGPEFDAKGFVRPGLWCRNGEGCEDGECPDSIEEKLRGWKSSGIQGAWIWLLDDVLKCEGSDSCSGQSMDVAAYAKAITAGLG